jgi:hypothetical protein
VNKAVVGLLALIAWRQLVVLVFIGLLLLSLAPQIVRSINPVMGFALLAVVIADPYLRRWRFGSR